MSYTLRDDNTAWGFILFYGYYVFWTDVLVHSHNAIHPYNWEHEDIGDSYCCAAIE